MTQSTLSLASISPEDLAYKLLELSDKERKEIRFLSLSISGPDVLVQSFNIPGLKIPQVKDRLKLVSVELLNLPADQVAFDYQILSEENNQVCGVFSCAPKTLMDEYVKVIKETGFTPLSITPYILTSINAFYQNGERSHRFCLLDFTREGYLNLAVIHQQKFELLRKVQYENAQEATFEIIQSLRSACAKSSVKHFDRICCTGEIPEREKIIPEVEQAFDTKTQYKDAQNVKEALTNALSLFSINLIRDSAISIKMRKNLLVAFNIIICMLLLGAVLEVIKVNKLDRTIQDLNEQRKVAIYGVAGTENNGNL